MRKTTRRRRNKNNPSQQLFAIVAILLFFGIWNSLFPPPPPVAPKKQTGDVELSDLTVKQIADRARDQGQETPLKISTAPIEVTTQLKPAVAVHTLSDPDRFEAVINSHGDIHAWSILEHQYRRKINETESAPYLLTTHQPQFTKDQELSAPFLSPIIQVRINKKLVQGDYEVSPGTSPDQINLTLRTPQIEIKRSFKLIQGAYRILSDVQVKNLTSGSLHIEIRGISRALQSAGASEAGMFTPPLNLLESVCAYGTEFERDGVLSLQSKIEDKELTQFNNARWYGVDGRYFMTALSTTYPTSCAQVSDAKRLMLNRPLPEGYSPLSTESVLYADFVETNQTVSRKASFYGGPKKIELLKAAEPELSQAIDFGIFSPICLPMLWAMGFFFSFISNWGVAIILLTVLVKLITLPLTLKQYKSMAAMKAIQPELAVLKEECGDDKMRLQQETMALYKKHNVNPLSGCLPMLVMMPIYFALYRTIYSAVELYQAPFVGWLNDLSMPDPYFITPVLLAILMLLQSRLQPTNSSMDPAQRKMLTVFMPLFFGAMMLFLPSALVLYILVNTVLGLFQQQWSQRQMEATS